MGDPPTSWRRRRLLAVLVAVVCSITFAATASAGPADDEKNGTPPGKGPDKAESEVPADVRERQEPLVAVAQLINAAVDPFETGRPTVEGAEGYLFLRLSVDDGKLLLYWKGELPDTVQEIISSHPEVKVEVRESAYTANDYMDAQDQLWQAASKEASARESVQLVGIEHLGDLAGFKVVLFDPKHSIEKASLVEMAPVVSRLGVSVEIAYVDSVEDMGLVANRQDDSYPWWGGAQIALYGPIYKSGCTSGYPVVMNGSGNEYLTTAWHCVDELETGANTSGKVVDGWVDDPGTGDDLGIWKRQASWVRKDYDVALVKADLTLGTHIFRGNAWSEDHIELAGAGTSTVGETVCINGANTGSHCSVKVMAKNEGWVGPSDGVSLAGHVRARSVTSGALAAAQGDSGGPVYRSSGSSNYGLGTISRGTTTSMIITCPSTGIANHVDLCMQELIYTSLSGALDSFDAELK